MWSWRATRWTPRRRPSGRGAGRGAQATAGRLGPGPRRGGNRAGGRSFAPQASGPQPRAAPRRSSPSGARLSTGPQSASCSAASPNCGRRSSSSSYSRSTSMIGREPGYAPHFRTCSSPGAAEARPTARGSHLPFHRALARRREPPVAAGPGLPTAATLAATSLAPPWRRSTAGRRPCQSAKSPRSPRKVRKIADSGGHPRPLTDQRNGLFTCGNAETAEVVTVSRPVSGILSGTSRRRGGHPSMRPTWGPVAGPAVPGLALLRAGVAKPPGSPRTLVRSYHTVSPLPVRPTGLPPGDPPSAVCSLLPDPTGHPVLALASTLPCGVPTFLDPCPVTRTRTAATRSTHRRTIVPADRTEPVLKVC